jgi:class 3 adenylate cyclase
VREPGGIDAYLAEMAMATDTQGGMPGDANGAAAAGSAGATKAMRGERRIVTVLFADVVNSTGLAENLDPEDWTEIMNGAFEHLTGPIHRYEGTVARLMGDGMLAFFGSPAAHEDDPQRAVLAALDIVEAIRAYGGFLKRSRQLDFSVRIGINTGPVVVADVGSAVAMEVTAMGDAVNTAARMQQTAAPGTVQLSAETYRLVAPLFDVKPLGNIDVKGKSGPLPTYQVVGLKPEPERLRGRGVVAPLIGRDGELAQLKQAADQLREGRGQIVCLIGEAGLGKSRLLAELRQYWLDQSDPFSWDVMYGVPYDATRPFGLFQNYARGMFGIHLDDTAEAIHQKVAAAFRAAGATDESMALCSVAMERVIAAKVLHEAKEFPAETVKQDIYDIMYPAFRQACLNGPMICMVDDLQWADPASVDLLVRLLDLTDEVPLMILCAFRPERQSPAWQMKLKAETDFPHRYTEIMLRPLGAGDSDALVSALLQVTDLPGELHDLIARKTEGNPYFIEEVIRSLIDQGAIEQAPDGLRWREGAEISSITIPDSLQTLLMARIDRLDQEAKSTLQMASVIGRSFYYRILQAISDSALAVDRHLHALERVELLREAGRTPELEYIFKHELARDAAYATILNRKRREFHLRVAEAIESLFAGRLEEHAHRLAQHFERAGEDERAMRYSEMAGRVAADIHANAEGIAHYTKALEAAQRVGASPQDVGRLEAARRALQRSTGAPAAS